MQQTYCFSLAPILVLAILAVPYRSPAEVNLGDPPRAPADVSGLPGGGPRKQDTTGGFSVNTDSREQVRAFYRAVYTASDGVAMDSTADAASCTPGTNSIGFQNAVLRRINWFRAMAGVPAAVTLDANNSRKNQAAAVLMSANANLSHFPPPTWQCFNADGANAASNSNLALGSDGADSISGYIWDFGQNNYEVGHRRWVLYPQTQVMGTGDVPATSSLNAANATWVFDAHLFGPRPATRQAYVAWPPEGFVPYQVVYPRWSLALSNADFTAASVNMTSNGVVVAVAVESYLTGYGENTLVWVPLGLDATSAGTVFPFDGADTVYGVTVSNIKVGASPIKISYSVTLFDPASPGPDTVLQAISGASQAPVNASTAYVCLPANNPNVSSYQWRVSQLGSGNLTDDAQNGLANFTISPAPDYPIITNAPDGSGKCFHLAHADVSQSVPQLLQLVRVLLPTVNTVASFKSRLGWSASDEVARVQASADGGSTWQDIYAQAGTGGAGESAFSLRSISLSNYAGRATLLRFNYDFAQGNYFPSDDPTVGWCFEDVALTNTDQLLNSTTTSTPSTNFTFTPTQTGDYTIEAQAIIFTEFPLGWGPAKQVTAVANNNPTIVMSAPALANNQVQLDFSASPASGPVFKLLQTSQLNAPWTTNTSAILTTNASSGSYRFTAAATSAATFYRILRLAAP